MPASHALNIHGYLLCYSIASRSSFEVLRVLRDKILELRCDVDIDCSVSALQVVS